MRQSQLFLATARETPSEADVASHQLMLRAGLVRQFTSGVYSFLPLGWRVLQKVENIVRQEMDAAGAQEVLLPIVQTEDIWERSGRSEVYGEDMFRLQDRHKRNMVLGPTHEEVITLLVRQEVRSYRQLPVTLYQIQTKFRDEARPRAGLLRGREFRMKDAYSFDADALGLDSSYQAMYAAYCRIFERIGIEYRAVEADPGAIGGEGGTHEFMVLSEAGEDNVVSCSRCSYSANVEKASGQALTADREPTALDKVRIETGSATTIDQLSKFLQVDPSQIVKVLVYIADGVPLAVCVRGDHEVNEVKLKNVLGVSAVELASAEEVKEHVGLPIGFVGPIVSMRTIVDRDVLTVTDGVAACESEGYHEVHVLPGRDFPTDEIFDVRNVTEGDLCPKCGAPLLFQRGIEVGHVFKLGTRYSDVFETLYKDADGVDRTILMGCYGLGTSRIVAAIVEQCHDEDGIVWPMTVAPFQVHVVPVNIKDEEQSRAAVEFYTRLRAAGVDALLDDREERPGVKFKDADLLGMPLRITVGNKIRDGLVELKYRRSGHVDTLAVQQAFDAVLAMVK